MTAKRIDKRCEICGCMMVGVHCNQKFCRGCQATRKRERERSRADRRSGLTIRQIVRLAADEGLSYGQYVSKHGLH